MTTLTPPPASTHPTRPLAERLKELSDLAPRPTAIATATAVATLSAQVSDLSAQLTDIAPSSALTENGIAALAAKIDGLAVELGEVKLAVTAIADEIRAVVEDSALQVVGTLLSARPHPG